MLKRDNWTNDEVIAILRGELSSTDAVRVKLTYEMDRDGAILDAIDTFEDFKRDPDDQSEYSAKAYNTETDEIVHVGTMPPQ